MSTPKAKKEDKLQRPKKLHRPINKLKPRWETTNHSQIWEILRSLTLTSVDKDIE